MKLIYFCLSAVALAIPTMDCPGPNTLKLLRDRILGPMGPNCQDMGDVCTNECRSAVTTGQAYIDVLGKVPTMANSLMCLFDFQKEDNGRVIKNFIVSTVDGTYSEELIADFQEQMQEVNFDGIIRKLKNFLKLVQGGEADITAHATDIAAALDDLGDDEIQSNIEKLENLNVVAIKKKVNTILTNMKSRLNFQNARNSVPFEVDEVSDGAFILGGAGFVKNVVEKFSDTLQSFDPPEFMSNIQKQITNFNPTAIGGIIQSIKEGVMGLIGGAVPGLGGDGGNFMGIIEQLKERFQELVRTFSLGDLNVGSLQGLLAGINDNFMGGGFNLDALKNLVGQIGGGLPGIGGGLGGLPFGGGAFENSDVLRACAGAPDEVEVEALKLEQQMTQTIALESSDVATTNINDDSNANTNDGSNPNPEPNTDASSAASLLPGLTVTLAAAGTALLV